MRKYKRRVNGQKVAVVAESEGRDVRESVWGLPVRGTAEEEWRTPPADWGLPDGEGICVGKVQNVGSRLVFFGEGCVGYPVCCWSVALIVFFFWFQCIGDTFRLGRGALVAGDRYRRRHQHVRNVLPRPRFRRASLGRLDTATARLPRSGMARARRWRPGVFPAAGDGRAQVEPETGQAGACRC